MTLPTLLAALAPVARALELPEPTRRADLPGLLEALDAAVEADRLAALAALTAEGRSDPELARELGLSAAAVRSIRRRAGIEAGADPVRPRSGWETRLGALVDQGLGPDEIANETGWSLSTVTSRLSRLGLSERAQALAEGGIRATWSDGSETVHTTLDAFGQADRARRATGVRLVHLETPDGDPPAVE